MNWLKCIKQLNLNTNNSPHNSYFNVLHKLKNELCSQSIRLQLKDSYPIWIVSIGKSMNEKWETLTNVKCKTFVKTLDSNKIEEKWCRQKITAIKP